MKNLGVRLHEYAAPTDVLTAQCDLGFAHVTEGAMQKLLAMQKKALPSGNDADMDMKAVLTMHCIAAIKPGLDTSEVSKRLNQAFVEENPDCYASLSVDAETLNDVVDHGEAIKVAQYVAGVQKSKAKKTLWMHTRDKVGGKLFKHTVAPKWTAADKKPPRWLPPKDAQKTGRITEWIESFCPKDVRILCDDYNGRWRVIAPTLQWRSISWTKRGHEKAALEVIEQAWQYEFDWNGAVPPFDLEELRKRYME